MSNYYRGGEISSNPLSAAAVTTRATFIVKVYNHLFAAILAFTGIEIALFRSGYAESIAANLLGVNWLLVLGGFVIVSWIASRAAYTAESLAVQYAALAAFVVAEAIIFVPLLYIADQVAPGAIKSAKTTGAPMTRRMKKIQK